MKIFTFTNFLICIVSSALSIINKGNVDEVDKNLFIFFFRGSFSSFYDTLFPKSIAFRLQVKKRKKQLTDEISEIVSGMSDQDIAWMHTYFRGVEANLKKKHSFEWEPATESDWKNKKKAEAYARKMSDMWTKKLDKTESASIQPYGVDAEQLVLDMQTVVDGRSMPESVGQIVGLINNYVFELKYLHMSSVNKDLVQVTKYMIEEGNAKLLDDIKEQLDIVAQWNSRSGGDIDATNVADVVARDPYCFVRLVCPSCQSTGNAVKRYETYAECTVCGERYEIIQNVVDREDEIQKLIASESEKFQDALRQQMAVVLQGQGEQTEQVFVFQQEQTQKLTSKMDELWWQVKHMTYKNADSIFKEIREGRAQQELNLQDAEARMEKMLAELLKQHSESILAMHQESMQRIQQNCTKNNSSQFQRAIDTLDQVKNQIVGTAQRNDLQFDEIKSRMDHYQKLLSSEMDRLKESMDEAGNVQTTNFSEMREQFESWTAKMEVLMLNREPVTGPQKFCTLCRKNTPSIDGLCSCCKMAYEPEPIVHMKLVTEINDGVKSISLNFDDELPSLLDDRPVRIQLFVEENTVCAVANRRTISGSHIRLTMPKTVSFTIKKSWHERRISPTQVVLIADAGGVHVNSAFAQVLQREWLASVREIVGGQGVIMSLDPEVNDWLIDGQSFKMREDES